MSETFVDIIGYQLEKIHTGVIAWLLDCDRSPLPLDERTEVIAKLAPDLMTGAKLRSIKAIPEYSFGRRRRIDLVLKMTRNDGAAKYLLIECKTDSDVSFKQLEQSEEAFLERKPYAQPAVISLALGAGQFTMQHQMKAFQQREFRAIDLDRALDIFSKLSISGHNRIYDQWITSMLEEKKRASNICKVIQSNDIPIDDRLRKSGYRTGFPFFYLFYDKIREHLEIGLHRCWAIYSGRNNPVMNWQNGWIKSGSENDQIQLYWEFNRNAFCLKAAISNESSVERWAELRSSVIDTSSTCPVKGKKTRNSRGTWVTAYKWEFDFCKERPIAIAEKTNSIISDLHERLRKIVQESA